MTAEVEDRIDLIHGLLDSAGDALRVGAPEAAIELLRSAEWQAYVWHRELLDDEEEGC